MSKRVIAVIGVALIAIAGIAFGPFPRPDRATPEGAATRAQGDSMGNTADDDPQAQPGASTLEQRIEALRAAHTDDALRTAMVDAIAAVAEADPEGAVRAAAALSDAEGRIEALHESLPHWLAAAPAAARAWLHGDAAALSPDAGHGVARDAAVVDPALGLTLAQRLPLGARGSAIADVFSAWTARDPEAAARAAELLKGRDLRAAAGEVARLWTEASPEPAFAWASALTDVEGRRVAVEASVAGWAAQDPAAAAAAALALPPAVWRTRTIDSVTSAWAQHDQKRALDWVKALPDAQEREAAAATLLAHVSQTEPAVAVEWAAQIAGSAENPLVTKVVAGWVARDATAAVDWAAARPRAAPHRRALLDLALERWQAQDPSAAASWLRVHRQARGG